MNLRNLKYFIVLSHSKSYGEAAETLGISKSTLSYAISKLEAEFGTSLVHTTKAGFSLTADGRALVEPAQRAVEGIDNLPFLMKRFSAEELLIGVPRRCDPEPLVRLLRDFRKDAVLPVKIRIVQETYNSLKNAVRTRKVDFGYCNRRKSFPLGSDFEEIPIGLSSLYCHVCTRSSLAAAESVSLRDLVGHPIAVLDGIQEQHLRQFMEDSGEPLMLSEPAMHHMGVGLSVSLGDCVALDYQRWTSCYSNVISIPVDLDEDKSGVLKTQPTLFCLDLDGVSWELPQSKKHAMTMLWEYAKQHSIA